MLATFPSTKDKTTENALKIRRNNEIGHLVRLCYECVFPAVIVLSLTAVAPCGDKDVLITGPRYPMTNTIDSQVYSYRQVKT